jgi:hypothetical protein
MMAGQALHIPVQCTVCHLLVDLGQFCRLYSILALTKLTGGPHYTCVAAVAPQAWAQQNTCSRSKPR